MLVGCLLAVSESTRALEVGSGELEKVPLLGCTWDVGGHDRGQGHEQGLMARPTIKNVDAHAGGQRWLEALPVLHNDAGRTCLAYQP